MGLGSRCGKLGGCMLSRFAARFSDWAQRWVPDPFLIALGLTVLTFLLGWLAMPEPVAGSRCTALAAGWLRRAIAPDALAFTTQIALILVTGSALARAPLVARFIDRLAERPRTTAQAAWLTATVTVAASLVNWGFGLIAGAVLARQIGARASAAGRKLDYPLVAAAGYVGLMVFHGGLSGSAPLKVAEPGATGMPLVPLADTVLSPMNLAVSAALLLCVPWIFARMANPAHERHWPVTPLARLEQPPTAERAGQSLAARLLLLLVLVLAIAGLVQVFSEAGALRGLSLGTVIVILLVAGLLLFASPLRYAQAFEASAGEAGAILLQFPFYFGILGLLETGGLVQVLAGHTAQTAAALANLGVPAQAALDFVVFCSAAVVNMFVPSGGGQWAIQGPIVLQAAADLQLSQPRVVLALAYGDEWSNMLQPFWALPLLGITGLAARDILGYTLAIMICSAPIFLLAFALF
ncbi:MAG: TIGR00366 family protein [Planctomycetota bacterium]